MLRRRRRRFERACVAPVANGPWEAMRFVPLVHAGRGEGVGGAWVASSASAIFLKSLERPRVPKSWKALLLAFKAAKRAIDDTRQEAAQGCDDTLSTGWASVAGPPARRQRAPKLSSTACRALFGWARRTSRAGLSCHLPLRTLARGCRRRRVVRPRVRGRSSSSGRAHKHYASGPALARPP